MYAQEKLNIVKHLNSCMNNVLLAKKMSDDLGLSIISGYLDSIEKGLSAVGAEVRLING